METNEEKAPENYETPELFTSTESQKLSREGRRFFFHSTRRYWRWRRPSWSWIRESERMPLAIQKEQKRRSEIYSEFPWQDQPLPTQLLEKIGAGRVMLKPAAPGTGVIAGGAARIILEEAGIRDVLCKSSGSPNHINVARATIDGLRNLQRPDQIANLRVSQQKSSSQGECSLHIKNQSALFANWRRTKWH